MLTITVHGNEHFDDENQEFITEIDCVLELEHSLATLSKWESIHEKAFLGPKEKTPEELYSYIECMIQSEIFPEGIVSRMSAKNFNDINAYINQKSSATWFNDDKNGSKNREIITAEIIYYWMISFTVPLECENWHLNKLFTLLKVCSLKQEKPKKRNTNEMRQTQEQINEQRKSQLGTSG